MSTLRNKDLKKRILELSYKYKLSHIGSCLTAVDIIDDIYTAKSPKEKFILSSGHAGLALYCVIEKYEGVDAEKIWLHHGVHPDRCEECHIYCSTGSLGNGLPIAAGMALADRSKEVYVLCSDGEVAEGSTYEALNIIHDQELDNLHIFLNANGYSAYRKTSPSNIWNESNYVQVIHTNSDQLPFLKGLDSHYHTMTEEEYGEGVKILA